jgi:hypothetical protein
MGSGETASHIPSLSINKKLAEAGINNCFQSIQVDSYEMCMLKAFLSEGERLVKVTVPLRKVCSC